MTLKVYVSGVHSGDNPSPGLGVARSIREAFPNAVIIGIDYSPLSSGLHLDVFNDVIVNVSWDKLELEHHREWLRSLLDDGYLIPTLDAETWWIAKVMGRHPRLLAPSLEALTKISKLSLEILINETKSPFKPIPTLKVRGLSEDSIYEFCCRYGWDVWVKGVFHDAIRVSSWREYLHASKLLKSLWRELIIQSNIKGYEKGIAFVAYEGQLLDSVMMTKLHKTGMGKTWTGRIEAVPSHINEWLKNLVSTLRWTGGGEIEFISDDEDNLWLLEINPRFPAWIYGATIAGHNLPGLLIERATGIKARTMAPLANEFTRIVLEVPVRSMFALPEPLSISITELGLFKHPSGSPELARIMLDRESNLYPLDEALTDKSEGNIIEAYDDVLEHVVKFLRSSTETTPKRILIRQRLVNHFRNSIELAMDLKRATGISLELAYSIKTDPDIEILRVAFEQQFLAEAITQYEVAKARSAGFDESRIILNGPAKFYPSIAFKGPYRAVFADSLAELTRIISYIQTGVLNMNIIGFRIRPPVVESRFGIPIGDYDVFRELIAILKSIDRKINSDIGISFHIQQSVIGTKMWFNIFEGVLSLARTLEESFSIPINYIDVGGGWTPSEWFSTFFSELKSRVLKKLDTLKSLKSIIAEPGKAIVQGSKVLVSKILEIRNYRFKPEIVVDASIAELPEIRYRPHRMLFIDRYGAIFEIAKEGEASVLGRLCMEDDILARNVSIPSWVSEGDYIVFLDAGAYDQSMEFSFGRG